ncbi:polysaccharide biosynthesis tyrosine autokinase [Luteolibacter sp. GHJ8]|uniref:Polysaccharide biosynthesis tyrosine autokinase n=1 Tax=Luteolibacter rhizosphaerae TaxID=2989719 RepID=A0ABT3G340_9BACT|nr:polysaccharide biosynthesis tyrosine autokinase [Luteolibacter rhizosphaerae]MCW1913959.1 polysaccharide biosynthesis tyrosine autokinase [Luteolibacter rhizosphaerae]
MAAPRKPEHLLTNSPPHAELATVQPTLYLSKVEPGRLLGVIIRRGWLVILGMLLAVGAMWLYVKSAPKIYVSTGSVEVSSHAPDPLRIEGLTQQDTKDLEQLRTIEGNMVSTAVLLRVAKENGLLTATDFAPPGTTEQGVIGMLSKRVRVELKRGTRVVAISVEDTDPARAKRLVESLVTEYQAWIRERRETVTKEMGEGLAKEEQKLREQMGVAEVRLQAFREQHPVPGLDEREGAGPVSGQLGNLNTQLSQAKSERLRLEAEYEAFKKFDPEDPDALAGIGRSTYADEVLAQARALQAKELEFSRVKERYLHKHPGYKEVAQEVETLKADLAEASRSAGEALEKSYHVAMENEAKLQGEVDQARTVAVGVEGVRAKFDSLKREAEAARELHASVDKRLRESNLAGALAASAITWAEPPLVPEKASKPVKMVLFPVAAFAGMLGGLVLMVGLEVGDGRVRDSADAARATGTPLLTSLPVMQPGREGDMVLLSDPASSEAEAFRRLRAVLLPAPGKPGARTVLFTSAVPGEGRSLCAMNYAASLAMQGQRTLLLDADMRRPGLSRQHVNGEGRGLGAYLAGDCDPASACFPTALPNLYLLSSGPIRGDAAELLSGTRFAALLEDAYRWFDAVVIDSPPVLAVSDALAVSRYADRVCLIVRQDASDRRNLKKTSELLRSSGGNLIGFVWNEHSFRGKGNSAPEPVIPVSHPALSSSGVAVADGPAVKGEEAAPTSPIA